MKNKTSWQVDMDMAVTTKTATVLQNLWKFGELEREPCKTDNFKIHKNDQNHEDV